MRYFLILPIAVVCIVFWRSPKGNDEIEKLEPVSTVATTAGHLSPVVEALGSKAELSQPKRESRDAQVSQPAPRVAQAEPRDPANSDPSAGKVKLEQASLTKGQLRAYFPDLSDDKINELFDGTSSVPVLRFAPDERHIPFSQIQTDCSALQTANSPMYIKVDSAGAVTDIVPFGPTPGPVPKEIFDCRFQSAGVSVPFVTAFVPQQ